VLGAWFGVAPQETILFSGIILANLQAGNPNATLDEVAHACRMTGVHEDTAEAFAKPINQLKG
jgi:subfamily B ATP-binding cassette protein HlyB/CyaB